MNEDDEEEDSRFFFLCLRAEKQWQELRRHCTVVRRVGSWVEYNDENTGMSFFFQQRSGRTVFETPSEVRTSEQKGKVDL
jgi:hypothetical protein